MSSDPLMLAGYEKVKGEELKQLQKRSMQLMQQDEEGTTKFPGAQPVSFERRHLTQPAVGQMHASLVAQPYYAAEKTDGVRYMLLVLTKERRGAFVVDRNFDMRRLPPMRFPSRADPKVEIDATLLDGELIGDRHHASGAKKRPRPEADEQAAAAQDDGASSSSVLHLRFLAYDACRVNGKACCDEPLAQRLMALRREVLSPRYRLAASEPATFADETFSLELKDFFALRHLPHIFSRVQSAPPNSGGLLYAFDDPLRRLWHGNDGIIFTPARDPYRSYTCPALLKWKPANMNSVDFKLQTKWRREGSQPRPQPRFYLCVATQGVVEPFTWITFSETDFKRFAADPAADTRIIECVFDPSWHTEEYDPDDDRERTWDNPRTVPGGWRFERIREDKNMPNDKRTVASIQSSVRDGVTAPQLLQALGIRASAAALQGAFAPPPTHAPAPPPQPPPPQDDELN